MTPAAANWPCPACAELIPANYQSCPHCRMPADWLDLLRALDFAVRRLLLWRREGALGAAQYHALVDACRREMGAMVLRARAGQPLPADTGLPPRCTCWSCDLTCHPGAHYCPDCGALLDTSEVRLLRYQQFLTGEIRRQQQAGRLTEADARRLVGDAPEQLSELRDRLDRGRLAISTR